MKCTWSEQRDEAGYFHCVQQACAGKTTKAGARRWCDLAARTPKEKSCRYLIEPATGYERIHCDTCNGNVRLKFPIHACEIHTTCLPTYRGEHDTMTCNRCISGKLGYEPKETL